MSLNNSVFKHIRNKRIVILQIVLIIFVGLLSRIVQLNIIVWDKYLGDMLYVVMFYYIFKLFVDGHKQRLLLAILLMIIFELIQLTGFTAYLLNTESFALQLLASLIGTEFSFIDIGVYLIGLILVHWLEEFKPTIAKRVK